MPFCCNPPCYDLILFKQLTSDLIKWAALFTHGAAGPSGVDVSASVALCNSLAAVARCLCMDGVDSTELMAFVACQLIPLDKKSGVQAIGIGDVPRRIIAKAVLYAIGDDIQLAAGALQTCAGHNVGSIAAIHAMKSILMMVIHKVPFLLMPLMPLILLIAKQLCIASLYCVHHSLPS